MFADALRDGLDRTVRKVWPTSVQPVNVPTIQRVILPDTTPGDTTADAHWDSLEVVARRKNQTVPVPLNEMNA